MTSQGSAQARYQRAIERKWIVGAEMAMREMGTPQLDLALDYIALLAELEPAKAPRAAVRWHGRLETETPMLTLSESQLALAALASLCDGHREALALLRRLLRRVRPTFLSPPA